MQTALRGCPLSAARPQSRRMVMATRPGAARAEVKLITTDVDGTLLNSKLQLTEKVRKAVLLSQSAGVPVLCATGKPPGGAWLDRVFPQIGPWPAPGVFLQGTFVRGPSGDVIYTRNLEQEVIQRVIAFGKENDKTIVAYCTDITLSERQGGIIERLRDLGEPMPGQVPDLAAAVADLPTQKMLVMVQPEDVPAVRPQVEAAIAGFAELTTAIPGILEILPAGACKGVGVVKLLEALGMPAEHLMALGDGENDVDMLKLAGLGVHMGNAVPQAIAAADTATTSNNEDGVALAIEQHVLRPRGLSLDSPLPADA